MVSNKQIRKPKVSIIILNYQTWQDTVECVESVRKSHYENKEIIVVDNCSPNDSVIQLKKRLHGVTLLVEKENKGYADGNNKGMQYAVKNGTDYLCILNNDVVVDENFLTELLPYMEANEDVGMCGPLIYHYHDRETIQSAGAMVNMYNGYIQLLHANSKNRAEVAEVTNCDYISGACLLLPVATINQIGYIPDDYFLFYEETEWCLKLKKAGKKVQCIKRERVYHKGSATIGASSPLSIYYMRKNLVKFIKRNGNLLEKTYFFIRLSVSLLVKLLLQKETRESIQPYLDGWHDRDTFRK